VDRTYYCCPIETVMRSYASASDPARESQLEKNSCSCNLGATSTKTKIEKLQRRAPRQAELLEAIAKLEKPIRAAELLRQTSLITRCCARW